MNPAIPCAIGYCRVSTDRQGSDGLGADAQRAQIAAFCAQRGWELKDTLTDVASGKSMSGRAGLSTAVARVEAGEAGALVVTKLDRLARSVIDGAQMIERANRNRWALVVVELGLDTSTPMGQFGAHILLAAAQLERAMIASRTKDALAQAKARGTILGRRLGAVESGPAVIAQIAVLRTRGLTLRAIAGELTRLGVPAPRGKGWSPDTIRLALQAHALEEAA